MKEINRRLGFCLILALWTGSASAHWKATILPPPPGIPDDTNTGILPGITSPINNKGQVVGTVRRPGMNPVPVVWTDGVPTVLPLPAGYHVFAMKAINDAGLVVAQIQADGDEGTNLSRPVVWNGTTPSIIPFYPFPVPNYYCDANTVTNPANYISNPVAINRAGHIAGIMATDVCGTWGWVWDTVNARFIYELEYTPTCLGPAPAGVTPLGINDADQVVSGLYLPNPITGSCNIYVNPTPALISPGQPPYLLPVPEGYYLDLVGNPLNNRQQTYGVASDGNAFFWTGSNYESVAPLTGSFEAINNVGQALLYTNVGYYIWRNGAETKITLPPSVTGLTTPAGINDAGQIASYAAVSTGARIVVLTQSVSCAVDVSSQITVTAGELRLNRTTGDFVQVMTLTNNSAEAISEPISLVLDDLPNSVSLQDLSGVTSCATPAASPFTTTTSSLAANGGSVSITLKFISPTKKHITYTTRVIGGAGGR
jgi:hypothetical protein